MKMSKMLVNLYLAFFNCLFQRPMIIIDYNETKGTHLNPNLPHFFNYLSLATINAFAWPHFQLWKQKIS